ncbi:transposase, partial [Aeromonas caviae]|uniref:transposase n=1 Tax=Aeromonas caviae TaxID=648 RepID=UPI002B4A7887
MVEVLTGAERRRRRTPQEKISIVQQTFEPGMTVSHVARLHDVNANLRIPAKLNSHSGQREHPD